MTPRITLFLIMAIFANIALPQQKKAKCGASPYFQQLLRNHPEIARKRLLMEQQTENFQESATKKVIEIPVVVHVLATSISAPENISKEQIYSQIISLNEDFAREGPPYDVGYPAIWAPYYAGDTQIRFCLATRDPEGNPTSGITRTMTSVTEFDPMMDNIKFSNMGGKDIWPPDQYMNVWVGRIANYLGYAPYPGGPSEFDGIVIDFEAFGTVGTVVAPYDRGKTLTHEVGHWLNLIHIWGEDISCEEDDLVADTRLQESPTYQCPETGNCGEGRIMTQNFMNYTVDICNTFFTQGQEKRMKSVLAPGGLRYPLTQSDRGCRQVVWREDD
ncbi:MAG: zinc metalloprotease [Bacteroidia bacterium]